MNIYYPDGQKSLSRITHLAIGAHQDDLEIMASDGIIKCYKSATKWFGGITCSDGGGSSRLGKYKDFSNDEIKEIRFKEQIAASKIGKYGAMAQLGLTSNQIKNGDDRDLEDHLEELIKKCEPRVIYTHNLADKHGTHVAVAKKVINILRRLDYPLEGLYGCEVWRGLDWMEDDRKIAFDLSGYEKFLLKLLGVYKSQIAGGKRYDLATLGRMQANATYFESHVSDKATHLWFAMDLKPLLANKSMTFEEYLSEISRQFRDSLLRLL